jgi:endonuclease/exonuclease/phosphatase family metal-dependent hydrolase
LRPLAVAALAIGTCACAGAINYLDPTGPLHEGRGAPPETAAQAPRAGPLRVVSFNIESGRKIDRALEVLRSSEPLRNPDLLALQEMDRPGVERVAAALGLNYLYVPSAVHPRSKREFGSALLSPWPLTAPRKLVLPHAALGTRLRRSALVATLERGAQRVRVYAVHLPSPVGITGASRRDEVRVLLADAAGSPDPVLFVGDFNSHGIGKEFVNAGYSWPTRDEGDTESYLFLRMSYDHVFVKGLRSAGEKGAAGVIQDNRGASDHRPIWVLLVPDTPDSG